jgi:hypothetical protein
LLLDADRFDTTAAPPSAANHETGQNMWTDTTAGKDQFVALVGVLRQEYAALAWLAFKVAEAELLTDAHQARFLTMITDEVDEVADELGTIEVARAMIVDELCEVLGDADDARSLSELIEAAPPEIAGVLSDLQDQLNALIDSLATTAARGTDKARGRLTAVRNALENLEPAAVGETRYNQWGGRQAPTAGATRFDTSL